MTAKVHRTTFQRLIDDGKLEIGDGYRAQNSELGGEGPIFLRAGHVTDTGIDFAGVERFHLHLAGKVCSKMSRIGDTVVTTKGNSTGRISFVTARLPQFVYSPHLSYWRSRNAAELCSGFLRYWSQSAEFIEQLSGMKASTDMAPYLSLTDQRRLRITLPTIIDQEAIASALGALDDKIELNRRMNATLEAMARALFQSWFVDFDPVRAKLDGREPVGMDAETAALFPDGFDESTLGQIPRGWRAGQLGQLCNLKRGHDLPTSTRTAGSIPIVSSSGITGTHGSAMASGPGVVTGRYGTIGKVFYVASDFWPLNTTLYVDDFRGNPARFVFHALELIEYRKYSDKGAVPGINRNELLTDPIVLPPEALRQRFATLVAPLWARNEQNTAESVNLAAMRDTLLPQLLSGALRVTNGCGCTLDTEN